MWLQTYILLNFFGFIYVTPIYQDSSTEYLNDFNNFENVNTTRTVFQQLTSELPFDEETVSYMTTEVFRRTLNPIMKRMKSYGLLSNPEDVEQNEIEIIKLLNKFRQDFNDDMLDPILLARLPRVDSEVDYRDFYWTLGFLLENIHRKQNKSASRPPIPSNSAYATYFGALEYPYEVKSNDYYKNFSPERFMDEMRAQSESADVYKIYYHVISRMLKILYTISSAEDDLNDSTSDTTSLGLSQNEQENCNMPDDMTRYIVLWKNRPIESISLLKDEEIVEGMKDYERIYKLEFDGNFKITEL